MPVQLDVIVGRDATAAPLGIGVGLRRERLERRAVDRVEELPAARAEPAHQPGVEVAENLAYRLVELAERQEPAIAQLGQDERSTIRTAVSTLALSRGRRIRVGSTAVP